MKKDIRQVILELYREDPDVVNDEMKLLDRVWGKYGWDETKSRYDNLCRMPHPETISRHRRKLHEQGKIKYSTQADERREQQYIAYRDEHGEMRMRII